MTGRQRSLFLPKMGGNEIPGFFRERQLTSASSIAVDATSPNATAPALWHTCFVAPLSVIIVRGRATR